MHMRSPSIVDRQCPLLRQQSQIEPAVGYRQQDLSPLGWVYRGWLKAYAATLLRSSAHFDPLLHLSGAVRAGVLASRVVTVEDRRCRKLLWEIDVGSGTIASGVGLGSHGSCDGLSKPHGPGLRTQLSSLLSLRRLIFPTVQLVFTAMPPAASNAQPSTIAQIALEMQGSLGLRSRGRRTTGPNGDEPYPRSRVQTDMGAYCGGALLANGHLFADPATMFVMAKNYNDVEDISTLPVATRRYLSSFRMLQSLVPDLLEIADDEAKMAAFTKKVRDTRSADRSNAFSSNQLAVMASISKELSFDLAKMEKNQRGFKNRETAYLLLSPMVEVTDEVLDDLTHDRNLDKYKLGETYAPRMLWGQYFDEDPLLGWMCSSHIATAIRGNILGPKGAKHGAANAANTNPSRTRRYRIKSVSAEQIAFGAVMVHFLLSSTLSWSANSPAFNYSLFYEHVLGWFDEMPLCEQQEVLDWYQLQVFGQLWAPPIVGESMTPESDPSRENDIEAKIMRALHARAAAATVATTSQNSGEGILPGAGNGAGAAA